MIRLIILSVAATLASTAAAEPGQVVGWPGGTADIKSYGPEGSLPIGRIEADGRVVLELPSPPPSSQTVDQTFGAGCSGEGGASVSPPGVPFTPASLSVERDAQELGELHLATSGEVLAWRRSWGQDTAAIGAWFQWVHVGSDTKVDGDCAATIWVDEQATESYEQVTEQKLALKAGWNLLRNDIVELYTDRTGKKHAQHIVMHAIAEAPADGTWFFVAY